MPKTTIVLSGKNLSIDEMLEWFQARPHYQAGGDMADYNNERTGCELTFTFSEDGVTSWLGVPCPETRVKEFTRELEAICDRFSLESDRSFEDLLADNARATREDDEINGDYSVPRVVEEYVWRWNLAEPQGDDGPFVPKITYGGLDRQVVTMVALPGPISALVPEVDVILGPLWAFKASALFEVLDKRCLVELPVRHWRIAEANEAMQNVFESAPRVDLPGALHFLVTRELLPAKEPGASYKHMAKEVRVAMAAEAINAFDYTEVIELLHGVAFDESQDWYRDMTHLLRAVAEGELARYAESERGLRTFLQEKPDDAQAWNVLGFFLDAAGRSADAKLAYEKALELLRDAENAEEDQADLLARRAYALLGLGRPAEAIAPAKAALAVDEQNAFALQHLGQALLESGDAAAAVEHLQASLEADEKVPHTWFHLARAHATLGQTAEAKDALTKATARSENLRQMAARDPLFA